MIAQLSEEAEEYIETIYKLQKLNGAAKTKDLAQTMHVVPGSITNTIEHLESHGLVTHEPYRGVWLTREGEKIALDIIRRHRLAERLLSDFLQAEWSSVHQDACKLEHALTKNIVALLDKRLGYPKVCPHGNPIPREDGIVEERPCVTLREADAQACYVVERIRNEENTDLVLLAEKRIKPHAVLRIVEREAAHVVVLVEEQTCRLGNALAENVLLRNVGGTQ